MVLGRFHGIDKLAGYNYSMTPYHFGANNPIMFNDPTGLIQELPPWLQQIWDQHEGGANGGTTWTNNGNGGFTSGGGQTSNYSGGGNSGSGGHWKQMSGAGRFLKKLFGGNKNGNHSGYKWER